MQSVVRVQSQAFDVAEESRRLMMTGAGAVVHFVGQVRAHEGDCPIQGLSLEHYPGMTEKALREIVIEAEERWPLRASTVIHRYGPLKTGEPIVFVGTASDHRQAAFEAAEFIMDYLKTRAPFWKKTMSADGGHWIEAKEDDEVQATRWIPE